uniref:Uncharacterized protein n=1 Tax=Cacopsylla melanoneura TaxID=428564 RepID=A0A8D8THV3_9HEMI
MAESLQHLRRGLSRVLLPFTSDSIVMSPITASIHLGLPRFSFLPLQIPLSCPPSLHQSILDMVFLGSPSFHFRFHCHVSHHCTILDVVFLGFSFLPLQIPSAS